MIKLAATFALACAVVTGLVGCKSIFWPPPHNAEISLFVICLVFLTFASGLWMIAHIGGKHGDEFKEKFQLLIELAKALGIKLDVKKADPPKDQKGGGTG